MNIYSALLTLPVRYSFYTLLKDSNKHCKYPQFLYIWLSIVFLGTVLHRIHNELEIPKYFCLSITRRNIVNTILGLQSISTVASATHLLLTKLSTFFVSTLLKHIRWNKIILLGSFKFWQPHCLQNALQAVN